MGTRAKKDAIPVRLGAGAARDSSCGRDGEATAAASAPGVTHGAESRAQVLEPLRLLPAKGQLQLYDFTSWVTLCSRCNAITVTDVSAITAQDA